MTDIERLQAENAQLKRELERLSLAQQQLSETRDRLDQAAARFSGMHLYNSYALNVHDPASFAEITAETVVDLFDLELGLFWPIRDGTLEPAPAATVNAPPELLPRAELATLLEQAGPAPYPAAWEPSVIWCPEQHPQLRGLGIKRLVASYCCGADRQPLALIVGGITRTRAGQYGFIGDEQLDAFSVFAQQVGVLLQNLVGQTGAGEVVAAHAEPPAAGPTTESDRAKGELLATMSHEIRTPLTGVIGLLQLLQDTDPTVSQSRYLKLAQDAADSLMTVVNDGLDFAKLEAGALPALKAVPFDPAVLAAGVVDSFRPSAECKGLALRMHGPDSGATTVVGDPSRVRQILVNLVGNAVKYTEVGEVAVECTLDACPSGRRKVGFTVRDTGIGLDPTLNGQIFEPFCRSDQARESGIDGSGLGLAICRRLCRHMGGEIRAEGRSGGGSAFHVQLPLPPGDAAMPPTPASAVGEAGDDRLLGLGLRSLLVEDNRINQVVARAMLTRLGLRVTLATDGAEALKRLADERFDMIFMDMRLPRMDGCEATRRLRAREQEGGMTRTPVIALTANALPEHRRACLAAGMDDYIAKPVAWQDLGAVVRRWGVQGR